MTTGSTRTLTVVSAGLREPSSTSLLASQLAAATRAALSERGLDPEVTTIELREHARDVTDNLLTGFASEGLQAAKDVVAAADGVITVTPIFSASYSGLFKSFLDLLDDDALAGTPVLLGATAGTARHSLALEHTIRPLLSYLRALTVPTAVFAAAGDRGNHHTIDASVATRIERAAAELATLVATREATEDVDTGLHSPSFAALLHAS